MEPLGPILSLPVGFTIFTAICIIIGVILSEVWWKAMKHLPEDEEEYDPENPDHFEVDKGKYM